MTNPRNPTDFIFIIIIFTIIIIKIHTANPKQGEQSSKEDGPVPKMGN